jgi:hypothetical protein
MKTSAKGVRTSLLYHCCGIVQACEFFDAESLALTLAQFPGIARNPFGGASWRAFA